MEITINIADEEYALLEQLATENSITTVQYITNIVSGWAQNQLRGAYLDYIKAMSVSDLTKKLGDITTINAEMTAAKMGVK